MKSNNEQVKQSHRSISDDSTQLKSNGSFVTDNRPSQLYQANLIQSIQRQAISNNKPAQLKDEKETGENELTNLGKGTKGVLSGLKGYDKMTAGKSNTATSLGGAMSLAASPLQVGGNILTGINEKSKLGKDLGNGGGMVGGIGKTLGSVGKIGKDGNSFLENTSAVANTYSGALGAGTKGMKLFGSSKSNINSASATGDVFGLIGDTADLANDGLNFRKDWKDGKYDGDHFKKARAGIKGAQNTADWTKSIFSTVESIAKATKASESAIANITQITSIIGLVSDSIGLVYNTFQIAKHLNNANTIKKKMSLMDAYIDTLLTGKITLQQAASRMPHVQSELKNFFNQRSILESILAQNQREPSDLVDVEKITNDISVVIETITNKLGEIDAIQQGETTIQNANKQIPELMDRKIALQKIHKLQLKKTVDAGVDTALSAAGVVGSSLTLSGVGAVPGLAIGAAVGAGKLAQYGVKKHKRNKRDKIDEGFKRSKIVKKSEGLENDLALDEYISNRIPYYMELLEKYGKINKKGHIEAPSRIWHPINYKKYKSAEKKLHNLQDRKKAAEMYEKDKKTYKKTKGKTTEDIHGKTAEDILAMMAANEQDKKDIEKVLKLKKDWDKDDDGNPVETKKMKKSIMKNLDWY